MMGEPLTKEDIYIGDFLIEMYGAIESYKDILGTNPNSMAVDTNHFSLLRNSDFGNWIDKDSMKLKSNVQIIEETRWNGTFMRMRSDKYKPQWR